MKNQICLLLILIYGILFIPSKLWSQTSSLPKLLISQGMPNETEKIVCSPNGKWLAIGGVAVVKIYDFKTGAELVMLPIQGEKTIKDILFSYDSKLMAIGSYENGIHIFETNEWKLVKEIENGRFPFAFSTDNKLAAYCDIFNSDEYLVSGGLTIEHLIATNPDRVKGYKEKKITILNTIDWNPYVEVEIPYLFITALCITSNYELFFNISTKQKKIENKAKIYSMSLVLLKELKFDKVIEYNTNVKGIYDIKLSPDDKHIAVCGSNFVVKELRTDKEILRVTNTEHFDAQIQLYYNFSPDNLYVVYGFRDINNPMIYQFTKYNLSNQTISQKTDIEVNNNTQRNFLGNSLITYNFQDNVIITTTAIIKGLEKILINSTKKGDNVVNYWNPYNANIIKSMPTYSRTVKHVKFLYNQHSLFADDGVNRTVNDTLEPISSVNLWSLDKGEKYIYVYGGASGISINAHSSGVISYSFGGEYHSLSKDVYGIHLDTIDIYGDLYGHPQKYTERKMPNVVDAAIHPHKDSIAFLRYGYKEKIQIFDISKREIVQSNSPVNVTGEQSSICYNYDGSRILFYGEDCIYIISADNLDETIEIEHNKVELSSTNFDKSLVSYPNSNVIAFYAGRRKIEIWSIVGRKCKKIKTLDGHPPLSISSDGVYLAICNDNEINIYNASNYKLKTVIKNTGGKVKSIDFSPNNQLFAVGNREGLVKLFNPLTANEVATLVSLNENNYFIGTPDGYYKTSKNAISNNIFFEQNENIYSFDQFDLKYNRPDIVLQRLGSQNKELIEKYHQAYLKRLEKNGIKQADLAVDLHVPEIIIDKQNIGRIAENKTLQLKVKAQDSKVNLKSIQIYVNGVPLYKGDGINITNQKTYEQIFDIPLSAGENKIQIQCQNIKGSKSPKELFFVRNEQIQLPNVYILGIGVAEHADKRLTLDGTDNDIRDLISYYKSQKGEYIQDVFVDTCINKSALKSRLNHLEKTAQQAGVDDIVILYFSGHGLFYKDRYYIKLYNSSWDNTNLAETGVEYDSLVNILENIPCRNRLLLLNACQSGEFDVEQNTFEQMQILFNDLREQRGIMVFVPANAKQNTGTGIKDVSSYGHPIKSIMGHAILNVLTNSESQNKELNVLAFLNQVSIEITEKNKESIRWKSNKPSIRSLNLDNDFQIK